MSRFAIVLCRNRSLGSAFLRFAMWSRWSHSALLDREAGTVYDSTLTHGGVRKWDAGDFAKRYPFMEVRPLDVPASLHAVAVEWLEQQLGKRYDWTALLSFVVRRDWSESDAWFCSEMTEAFYTLFVRARFRFAASRVTPAHQDMIA